MEKAKIDKYSEDYLKYGYILDAEVLNKGEKASVYRQGDEVYKVFDAPKSANYIESQGGIDMFEGKLLLLSTLEMPYVSKPTEIIYDANKPDYEKDILCYISNYLGKEYTPGMYDFDKTILLHSDLAKKMKELSNNELINPDGFNFSNLRIMQDGTFGLADLDGMQFKGIFTTQSRTDHFDRFLRANSDIASSYYNGDYNIYTNDVNVFNSIALFLFDTLGLNIVNYDKRYLEYLIKDIGIENNDIIDKVKLLFTSSEKTFFADADFEDLKNNYKIVEANGFTGTTKKFSRK